MRENWNLRYTKELRLARASGWEKYNRVDLDPQRNIAYCDFKGHVSLPSYSQAFFDKFGLQTYLTPSGPIIQLGAATGKFLEPYVRDRRLVFGYDYSKTAIRALRAKKIIARHVDFEDQTRTQTFLQQDLAQSVPVTVIAVRVWCYLTPEARETLVLAFINNAPSQSRFILVDTIAEKPTENFLQRREAEMFSFFKRPGIKILKRAPQHLLASTQIGCETIENVLIAEKR